MNNGDMPAMAVTDECGMPFNEIPKDECTLGLTKREYFAGMAMQGLLSTGATYNGKTDDRVALVKDAIAFSLALLEELEKEQGQ